jgi:YD repeat-containing protein
MDDLINNNNPGLYIYDNRGNIVSYQDNEHDFSYIVKYDENNNILFYQENTGYWYSKRYDERGNVIRYNNSSGYTCWMKYDFDNDLIEYQNNEGCQIGWFRFFIRKLFHIESKLFWR